MRHGEDSRETARVTTDGTVGVDVAPSYVTCSKQARHGGTYYITFFLQNFSPPIFNNQDFSLGCHKGSLKVNLKHPCRKLHHGWTRISGWISFSQKSALFTVKYLKTGYLWKEQIPYKLLTRRNHDLGLFLILDDLKKCHGHFKIQEGRGRSNSAVRE